METDEIWHQCDKNNDQKVTLPELTKCVMDLGMKGEALKTVGEYFKIASNGTSSLNEKQFSACYHMFVDQEEKKAEAEEAKHNATLNASNATNATKAAPAKNSTALPKAKKWLELKFVNVKVFVLFYLSLGSPSGVEIKNQNVSLLERSY